MQIIPVIDLKGGMVVHAVRGERSLYQPMHLHSRLAADSKIETVLNGLLGLHPFDAIYIADLDAITGAGNHHEQIGEILERHPQLNFWIDNGCQISEIGGTRPQNYIPVIGTESQASPPRKNPRNSNTDFILSLDYKQQKAAGHAEWFIQTDFWPENIIVMTLSRVGSRNGPDFEKLAEMASCHSEKNIIAAGGVRDAEDLRRLGEIGIHSALLASALHDGSLSGREIGFL